MRTFTFVGAVRRPSLSEFATGTARDVKDLSPTASLENELSVWLTEESLVRMLHDVGFSGTEKVVYPGMRTRGGRTYARNAGVLIVAASPRSRFHSKLFPNSYALSGPSTRPLQHYGVHKKRALAFHGLQHHDRYF